MKMSEKNRIIYYDLIKILATFMVCFYHLGMLDMGYVQGVNYFPNKNKMILSFCAMSVPLFFMVNGSLILSKNYNFKQTMYRFIKIIFLYYVWIFIVGFTTTTLLGEEYNISIAYIVSGGNFYTIHLWFLRTLAILTIITPFLKYIYEKNKKILYTIIILLLLCPFLYNYIVLLGRYYNINGLNNLDRTGIFTMYSVLYYILGKIISDYINKNKILNQRYIVFALLILFLGWFCVIIEVTLWTNINNVLFDGVNESFHTIGALLMSVGCFVLVSQIRIEKRCKLINIINLISSNIMGIYILHNIFTVLCRAIIETNISLILSIMLTILIMIITLVITIGFKKIPIINKFFII